VKNICAGLGLFVLLATGYGLAAQTGSGRCRVYMYLDDTGNSVRTRKFDSIPESKRDSVVTYTDCSPDFAKRTRQPFSLTHESATEGGLDDPEEWGPSPTWWEDVRTVPDRLESWQVTVVIFLFLIFIAAQIGLLIASFRVHILWGLGVLLLPVVPIVFIVLHWDKAKVSFLAWLFSWIGMLVVIFAF
jgi:hypothetical protein